MMKTKTIKTLLVAAITMAAMSVPGTANAQLGGLVKKAKQKAEQVVDKKKEEVKDKVQKAKEDAKEEAKNKKDEAKKQALESQRPEMPWIMGRTARFSFSDEELKAFVNGGLGKLSEDEVKDLREKLFARYKNNITLKAALKEAGIDDYHLNESIDNEQEMFHIFYDELESRVKSNTFGMYDVSLDGESATFKYENSSLSIPAGNSMCTVVKDLNGNYIFRRMIGGDKVFLKADEMKEAKDYIQLFHNIFLVSQSIGEFSKSLGEKAEQHGFLPFRALEWCNRMNAAMANNVPENIEYKAMPKAGSMHAKFKAEALAIAKADDPKVIDVIITSNDWDVLMKGLVPERRNIYGYIVTEDELGKICSERVWTQKYQGNGNYGKLKAGGVGVSADFYVK
jgi:gas vesicle protein